MKTLQRGMRLPGWTIEGLEFTQLLWEVVGSLVWVEVGLGSGETKPSLGLGREASCWVVRRLPT